MCDKCDGLKLYEEGEKWATGTNRCKSCDIPMLAKTSLHFCPRCCKRDKVCFVCGTSLSKKKTK